MNTKLKKDEQEVLKRAFYNGTGSCSGETLNTLWNELPLTAKKSIENILNAKTSSGITIELPGFLTKEECDKIIEFMMKNNVIK